MKWQNPSSFARHSTRGRHALHPCVWAANMLISLAYVRVETNIALIPSMLQPCLSKSWAKANIILLCLRGWLSFVAGSPSLTSVGEASDLQRKHFARQSAGFGSGFIHWSLRCYATFTLDTRYQPGSIYKFPAAILRNLLESRKVLHTQVYCNSLSLYIYTYICIVFPCFQCFPHQRSFDSRAPGASHPPISMWSRGMRTRTTVINWHQSYMHNDA